MKMTAKKTFLSFFLILLLLLTACGDRGGSGEETTTTGEAESSSESLNEDVTSYTDTGSELGAESKTDEEPSEEKREQIVLPLPYIDIDFTKNGTAVDNRNRVTCTVADSWRGNVTVGNLFCGGESYKIPHYRVSSSGGVLLLNYQELDDMYDLYEDLMGGFAMEAFLVNYTATDESSSEQCLISSTQSGGYNLTTLKGKYTASVYCDGAYRNAIYSEKYDTVELTHLVNVYDPNTERISLYVNGVLVDSAEAPGLIGLASGNCYNTIVIGGDISASGTQLYCSSLAVADFKLFRTPLDEAQVGALYERAIASLTGEETEHEILDSDSELSTSDSLFASLFDSFVTDVYQPDTALENAPTVLQYAGSDTVLLADKKERPATVLLHAVMKDGILYAADQSGATLGTMFDTVSALEKKMIPAFRFSNRATGEAVADFINKNCIGDCFVITSDAKLLAEIADSTFAARPLLEKTGVTDIDAEALFLECAGAGVKTVLLPAGILNAENMKALRARSINVVAVLSSGVDVAEIHNAVHVGVSGILTDRYGDVFQYYKTITDRTLCITPLIVAHRGDPESCPDNQLRSLISAAQSGATSIELDVWLTKDGHLVLNHDAKTTYFSEQLTCTSATRAQLKALTYTGAHAEADDEIAFLDEVFQVFSTQYTDKVLTIEVKDVREVTIDAIVELAKEYGMTGRILLIGMNHLVSNYTYSEYGLGQQMNQSYLVKKANPELSLKLGVLESTVLHSSCFTKHSEESDAFIESIYHRLIKYSTWTSYTYAETMTNYLCGVPEYTTNIPHSIDDFYRYLELSVLSDGKVTVTAVTYAGERIDVTANAELMVLDGNVTYQNGKIGGSGTCAFRVKTFVPTASGSEYHLCTPATVR